MSNVRGRTLSLVTVALLTSVLCIVAPVTLNMGPVPMSLATLVLYVVICVFGLKKSVASVLMYISIGSVGVPVFSGFTAGLGQLIGPTGGFIVGYVLMCAVSGALLVVLGCGKYRIVKSIVALFVGTVVMYVLGTVWYVIATGNSWIQAVSICVLPFVLTDAIKIVVAVVMGNAIRKRLVISGIDL